MEKSCAATAALSFRRLPDFDGLGLGHAVKDAERFQHGLLPGQRQDNRGDARRLRQADVFLRGPRGRVGMRVVNRHHALALRAQILHDRKLLLGVHHEMLAALVRVRHRIEFADDAIRAAQDAAGFLREAGAAMGEHGFVDVFGESPASGLLQIADVEGVRVVLQFRDRRMLAADRALRVAVDLDLAEFQGFGVVGQQAAGQQVADAEQELDGLGGLERADHARQHADHARLGAGGNRVLRRRLRKDAAVAGRLAGFDRQRLPVEPQNAAVGVRLLPEHAGIVDQELRREIVGAVDHEIVVGNQRGDIGSADPFLMRVHRHVGIDGPHLFRGRNDLGLADVGGEMDDLPLQVGHVHHVRIGNADGADARRGEVERDGRAEAARRR